MRTIISAFGFAAVLAAVAAAQNGGGQGLPRATPAQVGLAAPALERIAPALQAYVDSTKLPGALAVVARHGKVAYVAAVGSSDGKALSPDAVFRIFSMTKPIATTAVMQLYERGKLRLDDPVSKFIPAFADVKVFAGGSAAQPELRAPDRPVTIADLLTHTAGLTYGFFGETPVDSIYRRANLMNPSRTAAQLSDSLAHLPLVFSPGTKWNYSFAIDVVGRIVEVASGMTLDRYLDSAVFRPLGMQMTAFHATPAMVAKLAPLYTRAPDGTVQALPLISPEYSDTGRMYSGGGGLLSTPNDYLRFAQMLLNGGELDGRRVLKRETAQLMLQNHVPTAALPVAMDPAWAKGRWGFGYGGAVRMDADPNNPGSPGMFRWAGYGTTFFWIDPKADLIAMVWSQYMPVMEHWSLDARFQRLVYAAVPHDRE
jgi:CubicO group peptidase (beta-lactamase class C family)